MKSYIKSLLSMLGYKIVRKKPENCNYSYFRNHQMIAGLQRCKQRGLNEINTVIDIGAAAGSWTLSTMEIWPDANYVLFEPLEERKEELSLLTEKYNSFYFIPAAAGSERGTVNFSVSSDLDGSGITDKEKDANNIRKVDVTSINEEVMKLQLNGPFIVKLDTHGFEVPIIEGCSSILKDIQLFIIECYGFQIAKNSLLFWEMCQFMETKGFRLIDIVDVMNRPKDGAFWQCDAFFAPKSLLNFQDNSY